jgi:2-(3-amino-3-carboxypropyl)histidine synthase|tara:strand:- start:35153 stop:35905 length:753 start_codon:yes stop_codon:yes gene_type:complete
MVELLLIPAEWEGEIKFIPELKDYLEKNKVKSLALFSSVQFTNLDNLKKEIENLGIQIKTTKAKRTDKPLQILGCDSYEDSFQNPIIEECDLTLYIGDGMFHPKALLLSQINKENPKPILILNPIENKIEEINQENIKEQLTRYKRNLKMFINAQTLGILITIKPGQQYLNTAKNLKEKLEKENKKAYIFIDDTLNLNQLENYPFIDCWINTACPRIGQDDIVNIEQPMINLREANNPIKALEELEKQRT